MRKGGLICVGGELYKAGLRVRGRGVAVLGEVGRGALHGGDDQLRAVGKGLLC
jgi:hypothetical protein